MFEVSRRLRGPVGSVLVCLALALTSSGRDSQANAGDQVRGDEDQTASQPVEQFKVPQAWGGPWREIALGPQIGVTKDTFKCAESFKLLNPQPTEPGGPKEIARLTGRRTVTVVRPVFLRFEFHPQGREIHVAVNGNDSADGTAKAPMKTIAAALKKARAGDHVVVGAGAYYEALRIRAKGTADKPIVLRAAPGVRPRIELPPGEGARKPEDSGFGAYHTTVIRLKKVEHFQIHGFEIVGALGREDEWLTEYNSATGIQGPVGPGVIISENYIHNNAHCGIKLEATKPYLVVGNVIYNNGASRVHDHGTYHHGDGSVYLGNVFFANSAFAFHFYGTNGKHNIIRGNIIVENAIGVMMDGPENLIVNNVIAQNDKAGIWMWGTKCYDNYYANNLVMDNKLDIQRYGYGRLPLPTATFMANLFKPDSDGAVLTRDAPEEFWRTRHTLVTEPKLAPAVYDYRPAPGSPCIDAGADVGAPFFGRGPDIGAFEMQP